MCLRAAEQLLLAYPTAVKRILTEAKELREPTDLFHAQPLEVCDYSRLLRCSKGSLPSLFIANSPFLPRKTYSNGTSLFAGPRTLRLPAGSITGGSFCLPSTLLSRPALYF
jgi:hypothetical protein